MTQTLEKPKRKQKRQVSNPKRHIKHKKRRISKDFDSSHSSFDTPFADEELSTLDEFEHICKPKKTSLSKCTDPTNTAALVPKRKKVSRRRQIDPTTCERDYSQDEVEFMNALDDYKRSSGRMFPTCSEILEVLRYLGYEKQTKSE